MVEKSNIVAKKPLGSSVIRILVIDEEAPSRETIRSRLSEEGYEVVVVASAEEGLATMDDPPDLMILGLELPDIDGFDVLSAVRETGVNVPILVVSKQDIESRKVKAFNLGADDYVTKPFGIDEFLARVRTTLRHRLRIRGNTSIFQTGMLTVDRDRRRVKVNGIEVRLAPKEYELLCLLVNHAGKVLTHDFLLRGIGTSPLEPQYLRVYIRALRKKIEIAPADPVYILTELGVGYRLAMAEGEVARRDRSDR